MIYICTNCSNYSYDEARGDKTEGIEAGTLFDDLAWDFSCPTCGASKEYFLTIKEEINESMNKSNMTYLERAHVPKIVINGDICNIEVGYDIHPMLEDHYIYSIGLYDEYGDLIEEKLLTPDDEGTAYFDISDFDEFEVRARCSSHGVWTSGKIIK